VTGAAASPIPVTGLTVTALRDGEFEAERTIVASDPYQGGHYPDYLIYPGVFIVENVVRAVKDALAQSLPGGAGPLRCLRSGRFTAPVRPGDRLVVRGKFSVDRSTGQLEVRATCVRGDGVAAATVRLAFALNGGADAGIR
jgi:3-hydroxyacyl-[acyl-carrier-protein] dehydratase